MAIEQTIIENVNNVEIGKFPMMEKPILAQITIHVNNLVLTYGNQVIKEFKSQLYQTELEGGFTIKQLINHYGQDNMKEYFTLIYGWTFEKAG